MNANPKFHSADARFDATAVAPRPSLRKVYVTCSRPDVLVPMRGITQADTPTGFVGEMNSPIYVYDTSGPCTDPEAMIDIRAGLPALCRGWIESRGDTEQIDGLSSQQGRERVAAQATTKLRVLELHRHPRRAQLGENVFPSR